MIRPLRAGFLPAALALAGFAARGEEPPPPPRLDLAQIEATLTSLRELPFLHPVTTVHMTQSQAEAEIRRLLDEELPLEEEGPAVHLLSELELVPPGYAYREQMLAVLGEQVAGFYEPQGRRLVIVDFPPEAPIAKILQLPGAGAMVIGHELAHALADQHFDLHALVEDKQLRHRDDLLFARRCLAEGDATLVMLLLGLKQTGFSPDPQSLPDLKSFRPLIEASSAGQFPNFQTAPPWIKVQLLEPYLMGLELVGRAFKSGGWKAVDDLWRNPPESSEQILHPERAGDEPIPIGPSPLPAGWTRRAFAELGELGIRTWLTGRLGPEKAAAAAAGWDGDRVEMQRAADGRARLVWSTIWDSPGEAEEFAAAAEAWMRAARPEMVGDHPAWQFSTSGPWVILAMTALHPEPIPGVIELEKESQFPELR